MMLRTGNCKIIRGKKGQTIIETVLILIILLGLLFAIVDLALMLFANLAMQHAVREGARYAITGRTDLDPDDSRRLAVIQKIKNSSIGLCNKSTCNIYFYSLDGTEIPYDPEDPQHSDVGGPGEVIIVEVRDYAWSLLTPFLRPFFPDGKYTFTVKATMRNEPFTES